METIEIKLKAIKIFDMGDKHVCYVQANSIPESVLEWMDTNPRKQAEKKEVSKIIRKSLIENENFHELNRGIAMSVSKIRYDSSNNLYITLENPEIHGNIDGGHTLKAILNVKSDNLLASERCVFMEIFEGIKTRNELAKLAKARNTSKQVNDISIAELENRFKPIKEIIKNLPFADRVEYKQNQLTNKFSKKEIIDVKKIISILTMFNQVEYSVFDNSTTRLTTSHPILCYNVSKNVALKFAYNENRDLIINNMRPIIVDIFKLWDKIQTTFPDKFNKVGRKYGSKKFSKYNENKCIGKSCFYGEDLYYEVPDAIIYPLLGAFRCFVGVNENGLYYWTKDPFKTWEILGRELVEYIANNSNCNDSSLYVLGKDYSLWNSLLQTVHFYG